MLIADDMATMAARLGLAAALGLGLGLEREWHGHDAGSRTHALVALSSATITVSSLLLFDQVRGQGGQGDPLRVVQGLAQAIGFIAGGLIFIRGGDVRNMTTAASLWMAAAVGIGAGAGQVLLVAIGTVLALALLAVEPLFKRLLGTPARSESKAPATPPSRRGTTRDRPR
jgi:putative Mg2+ transporter-C (MgtC) family protein